MNINNLKAEIEKTPEIKNKIIFIKNILDNKEKIYHQIFGFVVGLFIGNVISTLLSGNANLNVIGALIMFLGVSGMFFFTKFKPKNNIQFLNKFKKYSNYFGTNYKDLNDFYYSLSNFEQQVFNRIDENLINFKDVPEDKIVAAIIKQHIYQFKREDIKENLSELLNFIESLEKENNKVSSHLRNIYAVLTDYLLMDLGVLSKFKTHAEFHKYLKSEKKLNKVTGTKITDLKTNNTKKIFS